MTGREIMDMMEEIAPRSLACEWDSVGVMTGSPDDEITGIMLCLDLTQEVLEEASGENCNMIITHHPPIFHPIRSLAEDRVRGKLLCEAVRRKMLVFSAHTNLDFAEGGVNDALLKQIGAVNTVSDGSGRHRWGELPFVMSVSEFARQVDEKLCAEGVRVILPATVESGDYIKNIGVCCGAYDGETDWIYACGIDVLITGEVRHSDAIDLAMEDFVTVAAGHYPTEIWGVDNLAMLLGERLMQSERPDAPEVFVSSTSRNPLLSLGEIEDDASL